MHLRATSVVIILIALSACGRGTDASDLAAEFSSASAADGYTLTWIAPTQYEDGSPLWNLAGIHIYRNAEMILDVDEPGRVSAKIDGNSGDIVWITAYDALGAESHPSDEVTLP